MEMYSLAAADQRQPDKRRQRRKHAEGLQPGRAFAQNQDRSKQRKQRAGCPNRRAERERQVFEREIGKNP